MPAVQADLESRLRKHVDVLAGLIGERNGSHPSALGAARAYLHRALADSNLRADEHPYNVRDRPAANLELVLPGRRPSLPALVVGAHYDTAPGTPGADDNASAVAILLEISRALAVAVAPLKRTLRCVFYDCEEPPHFASQEMGSYRHAKSLVDRDERILGMVCLESLGYYPKTPSADPGRPRLLRWADRLFGPHHIVIVSNLTSIPFGLPFALRCMTSGRFRLLPAALPDRFDLHALSDNRSYWSLGHRALMVTNTAMFRNPNYHTRRDTPGTLDYPRMARLTKILTNAVRRTCA